MLLKDIKLLTLFSYHNVRLKDSETVPFMIDPQSGLITVSESLDREIRDKYVLSVNAEDRSSIPYLVETCTVTVHVGDVNDCPPRFTKTRYAVHVDEK